MNKYKMERNVAFVVPVLLRDEQVWIRFGKYTRWLEWREDLGRYRTVWTERGWREHECDPPRQQQVQVNETPSGRIHIKIPDENRDI